MVALFAKSIDPNQTPHNRCRRILGLHCLPITRLGLFRLHWVLNPPVVYSTDRSKAVARFSSYSLLLRGLFYEAICCMSFRVSFCSCVFSPFSIAITSLGEERANLSAFRMFDRFVLVWFCLFSLPLGV